MKLYNRKYVQFIDYKVSYDECRKIAADYKKKHKWHDLNIGKKCCSIVGMGEGYVVYLDDDPDEFLKKLIQLHKDFP